MTAEQHGAQRGTDVLIRKVDGHLAALRLGLRGADLELAQRVGACLRALVLDTAQASAADRARVRVAVHYFVLRREGRGALVPVRSLAAVQHLVNRIVVQLGRPDLLVGSTPEGPALAPVPAPTPTSAPAAGDLPSFHR